MEKNWKGYNQEFMWYDNKVDMPMRHQSKDEKLTVECKEKLDYQKSAWQEIRF